MSKNKISLTSSHEGDAAYLYLPEHPGDVFGCVSNQISLDSLIVDYQGPEIYLDFNQKGVLIGIELLLD